MPARHFQPVHKTILALMIAAFSLSAMADLLAQEKKPELMEMSLEDILNIEVVTATKTARKIDEVPAVIEIVTGRQIKQRGYRHLADVLNDVADNHEDRGNWGIGEPLYQNTGFGFRFDTGQNILLLFNGQRLNAFMPGNRFGGEEYLLENIERIEIIRGPGSTLYGANAFTAVVNIISTSTSEEGEKPHLKLGAAGMFSASGKAAHVSWKAPITGKGLFSGAFRLAGEDGHEILVGNSLYGDAQLKDGIKYAADSDMLFTYNNFRAYAKISNQKRNTFTGFNGVSPADNDDASLFAYGYAVGADYTHRLSGQVEIKGSAGWHQDNWTESALIPIFKVNAAGTA